MRDRVEDALDLARHLRLVDRLEVGLVLERDERGHRRERRGSETRKRQRAGMTPSSRRRAKIAYEDIAAEA